MNLKLKIIYYLTLPEEGQIRLTKKGALFSFFCLIALIAAGGFFLFGPISKSVEAAWFNDDWQYRQIVDITNNGSTQTSYQIQVTLNTQSLISAGKMQSSCQDVRFTDINGKLLKYWTEWCPNTSVANPYRYSLFGSSHNVPSLGRGNGSTQTFSSASNSIPYDSSWHHIAVTMSGTTVTHYLDGGLNGSGTLSQTTTDGGQPISIGSFYQGSSGNLKGSLDDVRIYNYALTVNQIKQLLNQGAGVRFGPVTGAP